MFEWLKRLVKVWYKLVLGGDLPEAFVERERIEHEIDNLIFLMRFEEQLK